MASEQAAESLDRQTRVSDNSAQRECLDRIVPRDRHLVSPIAHHNLLSLTHNVKLRALQRPHRGQMVDSAN